MEQIRRGICGYAIKIESIQKINKEEADGYVQLFMEDFIQDDGFHPGDDFPDDYLEYCHCVKTIMQKIFGLSNEFQDEGYTLIRPIEWICELFGTWLDAEVNEMPPVCYLEFKQSKLDDFYKSPFGFPPEEHIGYLTLEEILEERKQLEGSLEETFEEASDVRGMNPQQIAEEKEVWNDLIYPARKSYLNWLDYCLGEGTDLIVIER